MYLIKNAEIYAPEYLGKKDVLISEKIEMIADCIDSDLFEVIDAKGKKLAPGFIDGHVHVIGGGGEGSFRSRTPEITLSGITSNGVTTVLGLLGTDGDARDVETLLAKTKALNEEGISAYCLSGSYLYPPVTITGDLKKDILFIGEVLGVKIALSDHRSSYPTKEEFIRLSSYVRNASLLSGKKGVIVIHMGSGKMHLQRVFEAIEETDLPVSLFHPTHVNRDPQLLDESIRLLEMGGYIDLSCSYKTNAADVLTMIKGRGIATDNITISSDGQGSWSEYDENGSISKIGVLSLKCLKDEFDLLVKNGFSLEESLRYFTCNVADSLGLNSKGRIEKGKDADLILLDENNNLDTVFARGKIHFAQGKQTVKGFYE